MKERILLLFIIMSISGLAFAQPCESSGFMGTLTPEENLTITETCPTCTFINISSIKRAGSILISNIEMTEQNGQFIYNLTSNYKQDIGTYYIEGYSNLDLPFKACFEVTIDGKSLSLEKEDTYYIFFIILTMIVGFVLYILYRIYPQEHALEFLAGIAFLTSGLIIEFFPSGFQTEFILQAVSLLFIGIGLILLAESIWDYFPDDKNTWTN